MKSKSIYLRALEPEDIDYLYRWENDPEIWKVSCNSTMFSMNDLKLFIESSHKDIHCTLQKRFIIATIENNRAIGTIDLYDFDAHNRRASIGIMIYDTENRNRGYASEAIDLIKQYAFEIVSMHQLSAMTTTSNLESIKLFKKAGFKKCAEKREWILIGSKWHDAIEFQLINHQK